MESISVAKCVPLAPFALSKGIVMDDTEDVNLQGPIFFMTLCMLPGILD